MKELPSLSAVGYSLVVVWRGVGLGYVRWRATDRRRLETNERDGRQAGIEVGVRLGLPERRQALERQGCACASHLPA